MSKNNASAPSGVERSSSRGVLFTVSGMVAILLAVGTRAIFLSDSGERPVTRPAPAPRATSVVSAAGSAASVVAKAPTSPRRSAVIPAPVRVSPVEEVPSEATTESSPIATATVAPVAEPVAAPAAEPATASPSTDLRALGATGAARTSLDWRTLLAYPGVTFAIEEITDASTGTYSLASAHAFRTHSNIELTLDLDSIAGVHGLTAYVQYKAKSGRNGSGAASFTQGFSNIDADDFRLFGEVYVEERLMQDKVRLKAGRLDFNTEFAGTDNGGVFLNASMGFSPSITAAPTYPLPTWGANVIVSPRENLTFSAGMFDGSDGAEAAAGRASRFQIAQASQRWTVGAATLPGRLGVGYFRHTGLFLAASDSDDAEPHLSGTHGWYGTVDQTLWQGSLRPVGADDEATRASIAAFAQLGYGDAGVQAIRSHQGGGLTFSGLSSHRPNDMIGVGVTNASWQDGGEFIGEMYYQAPVLPHLSLVADWQRVRRRESSTSRWFGSVFTMRTIVSF